MDNKKDLMSVEKPLWYKSKPFIGATIALAVFLIWLLFFSGPSDDSTEETIRAVRAEQKDLIEFSTSSKSIITPAFKPRDR